MSDTNSSNGKNRTSPEGNNGSCDKDLVEGENATIASDAAHGQLMQTINAIRAHCGNRDQSRIIMRAGRISRT